MKKCSSCSISKLFEDFNRANKRPDGLRPQCRECDKARDAKRYLENRELEISRSKNYYYKNTEDRKNYSKEYYKNHSETIKKKAKISYPKYKQSRVDNNRLRRAAKAGNEYSKYTLENLIKLYGNVCYLCNDTIDLSAPRKPGEYGWENGLHVDHVIDISAGGPDTLDNVRPTHGLCNLKKPRIRRAQ